MRTLFSYLSREAAPSLEQRSAVVPILDRAALPVLPGLTIEAKDKPAAIEKAARILSKRFQRAAKERGDPSEHLFVLRGDTRKLDRPLGLLGINAQMVEQLARSWGEHQRPFQLFAKFLASYGELVLGLDPLAFEDRAEEHRDRRGLAFDEPFTSEDWRIVADGFERLYAQADVELPTSLGGQIATAVEHLGRRDALFLQVMPLGLQETKLGLASSRNPKTGEAICDVKGRNARLTQKETKSLEKTLRPFCEKAEEAFGDAISLAFGLYGDTVWLQDALPLNRAPQASLRIAIDLVQRGQLEPEDGIKLVDPLTLDTLLHPRLDPEAPARVVGRGFAASPGAVSGKVVFDASAVEAASAKGESVILVRNETTPDEVFAIQAAAGIITTRGGPTSHAATVARGLGRPCVVGVSDLRLAEDNNEAFIRDHALKEGDSITIDGGSGVIMLGDVPTIEPELAGDIATILEWADSFRTMKVRANADTITEAQTAINFGAEGIGLVRTEHQFFQPDRLLLMQQMILAKDADARRSVLDAMLPLQIDDFSALLDVMGTRPVTIRLLDPPLHEFLPQRNSDFLALSEVLGIAPERLRARALRLTEANPMLGHRGCRLGLTYPEIYDMQVRAILHAAEKVNAGDDAASNEAASEEAKAQIQIMIPLVAWPEELERLRRRINLVVAEFATPVEIGTMIELPRAALLAKDIAEQSDFFSFGTNDLTQTTFGISRDDAAMFMRAYEQDYLIESDPFRSLDQSGVGELIEIAAERGRGAKPDLEIGICGEHGGDPQSIAFCQQLGLDYVSCSPYRVPVARLAAAHAALAKKANS